VAVHPGFKAELVPGTVGRARDEQSNDVIVSGSLKGKFPSNQRVDAALVASDGKSYGGTGFTDAAGKFRVSVGNAPDRGPGDALLFRHQHGRRHGGAGERQRAKAIAVMRDFASYGCANAQMSSASRFEMR